MLYLSEYSAGLVYYRTNDSTTIFHLVSIIEMLSLLARDKILLKHVQKIDAFGLYGTGPNDKKKSSASPCTPPAKS